ncbi:hypothetical protein BC830DRAFT_1110016 [Chytriomyces sp. MP71]|nr:hypothetical protein BC830DRAFT_1110016 [Chytriomyces sp. MP71]
MYPRQRLSDPRRVPVRNGRAAVALLVVSPYTVLEPHDGVHCNCACFRPCLDAALPFPVTFGIIAMIYTSVGGFFVSIRTDFLQIHVVLGLTLGLSFTWA